MKEMNTAIENQGLTRASGAGLLGRKCAVVFGAAGSIGAAVAKEFAAEGARVFLAGRTKDSLAAVAKQITNARGEAQTTVVDALDDAGVNRYMDGVAKQAGKINIAVDLTGPLASEYGNGKVAVELPVDEFMASLTTIVRSHFITARAAARHMIKQKSGRIIPISSTAGQRGESWHTHYGASKGGIISLTKGLSSELARHGITVNSVAPGWVSTDMSNPVLDTKAGKKMAASAIPLGRAATAEEVAGPILFLASDLANFINGEVLNVNGGSVLCG